MFSLKRSIVIFLALLGMFSVGIASANGGGKEKSKGYEVSLRNTTKVGSVVLKAGDYRLKLDGANAVFTKESTGETFTTTGKLETVKDRFDKTGLHQVQDGDQPRIISIELKGTDTVLKFD